MKRLNWHIKKICERNRDGSYATRVARERTLALAANELHDLGYRRIANARNLKSKHIYALVNHWTSRGITTGTIKNRMSHLRWLSEKTNNLTLLSSNNEHYGIPRRRYVGMDRSVAFTDQQITQIADPHIKCAALLQREFGLRREEAMKFVPVIAVQDTCIRIHPSWSKGGRGREIPVLSSAQHHVLAEVTKVAAGGSLIPNHRDYRTQVRLFEKVMKQVGLGKTHGARHAYAQGRYEKLTGFKCVARGGPTRAQMAHEAKNIDKRARYIISQELGHERPQIVAVYLGG